MCHPVKVGLSNLDLGAGRICKMEGDDILDTDGM